MPAPSLRILAGPRALARLRERGFDPDLFTAMLGASGGAKWLVLGRLDREVAVRMLARRRRPLFLLGSSIGSWRFCCYGRTDPVAALERFEAAYFGQAYTPRPGPEEVSRESRRILEAILEGGGPGEILAHPRARLSIMVARARHLAAFEPPALQRAGLLLAALVNAVSRRALGWFFERALFHDPRDPVPFDLPGDFPTQRVALAPGNLARAAMASASIPGVLAGVPDLPGAAPGMYRDGGVVDYHFDFTARGDGLVLYPHFYPHLVPGWFDKTLPWRRVRGEVLDRVVLLCPSQEFVAGLPGGKIPDRRDFWRFETGERLARWRKAVDASRRLAGEFAELAETGRMADRAEPFPAA